AQAEFVDPVAVVGDDVVSGLVGDPPQPNASAAPAAPITPSASRRSSFLLLMLLFLLSEHDCGQCARAAVPFRVRIGDEVTAPHQCRASHTPTGVTIRWRDVKICGRADYSRFSAIRALTSLRTSAAGRGRSGWNRIVPLLVSN